MLSVRAGEAPESYGTTGTLFPSHVKGVPKRSMWPRMVGRKARGWILRARGSRVFEEVRGGSRKVVAAFERGWWRL